MSTSDKAREAFAAYGGLGRKIIDDLIIENETMLAALRFIEALTGEELQYAKVGTGAEVALRHAYRRARDAIAVVEKDD